MHNLKQQKGFSLIEILVVAGIFAFITASLLSNVLRSRLNIIEVAKIVVSDIRTAQANSLAAKQYNGQHRCGYGIYLDPADNSKYSVYVGRSPTSTGCPSNWEYNITQDTRIVYTRILDSRLELFDPDSNSRPNYYDISFEPYNGTINIKNTHNPINSQANLSQIGIKERNKACGPKNCIFICVYSFGRISTRTGGECPLCDGANDSSPAACQQW